MKKEGCPDAVVPAGSLTQSLAHGIPAFAGVTMWGAGFQMRVRLGWRPGVCLDLASWL